MADYSDIINLPYPQNPGKGRMDRTKRAAMFMPFAALTGHDEAIKQAGEPPQESPLPCDDEEFFENMVERPISSIGMGCYKRH